MDIETCTWCNGEGINLAYKGQHNAPNCTRCQGSGKVLVTDELSTTKRRRKYMGPAPKIEVTVISADHDLTMPNGREAAIEQAEKIRLDHKLPEVNQPKRRGRPPNHA